MKKGDILTIVKAVQDVSGYVAQTDRGHVLGIIGIEGLNKGALMQIGPVCGDWCKVFVKGDQYQAQILKTTEDET